ncbi:MAG TPA: alpha/beta hydrolase [Candidatus Margulisiibacteriota bacterium]|nr:alpha/beta hydrolase [Candidatus Margulisiibacteriota bacterium]
MHILHGRVALALHELSRRDGPALLLLHALFGSSADWGEAAATWPGAVFALDFAGHGESESVLGGAYCPEMLAGDADAALAHIGVTAIAGAGVGAYVALLLAGARRDRIPAALLLPGDGLAGGGPLPDFDREFPSFTVGARAPGECDPMVQALDRDVRPVEYAEPFARAAQRLLLVEDGTPSPPWWEAARHSPSATVIHTDVSAALQHLGATQITDH